jgi:hypothetical protein
MKEPTPEIVLPPLAVKAEHAMKEAVAAAIAEHWRAGRPVYIWKDEQVVALYSDGTTTPFKRAETSPSSPGKGKGDGRREPG